MTDTKEKAQVTKADSFLNNRKGAGNMKPFIGKDGKGYEAIFNGGDPKDPKNYSTRPVTNAVLRYDEWRRLDDRVRMLAEQRLVGFNDLRRNGLVFPLNDAMGITVVSWEEISDALEAAVSIDPVRRTKNDNVDFAKKDIPIPVTHSDYHISERLLRESRNRGQPISTVHASRATRSVNEQLEDMLFGSSSVMVYGGGTIHTYLSHPDRNTIAFNSSRPSWGDSNKTAENIKDDVLDMIQSSIDALHFGPWMLYVPTSYETILDDDYKSTSAGMTQTIRQRIESIRGIQGVEVVDRLAADNVLLVQMTDDVVDLIDGMPIQNVQWDSEGGMIHNYKVMTIQVPRIRSDYNNNTGIVHMS